MREKETRKIADIESRWEWIVFGKMWNAIHYKIWMDAFNGIVLLEFTLYELLGTIACSGVLELNKMEYFSD